MFAPHCPTCERRVLLGFDQIVHGTYPGLILRCSCGELLTWDQRPPPESDGPVALAGVAATPAGR